MTRSTATTTAMRIAGVCLGAVLLAVTGWPVAARAADQCEPDRLAQKYPALAGKMLIVEQDGQSPPFTYRDTGDPTKIVGFDADYVRAAMACIGAKFAFKLGAWSGLLPALVAGQADLMWSDLYYSPARAKTVNFVTYMQAESAGLVAKGNPKHLKGTGDFCGIRATAGLGTVEYGQLQTISKSCTDAGKPPVQIVTFPDAPAGARLVANDRADVLLGDLTLADQFVEELPNQVEIGFRIPSGFKIGAAIRKNDDQLLNAVAEAVRILQADGTQAKLQVKYHLDPSMFLTSEVLTH